MDPLTLPATSSPVEFLHKPKEVDFGGWPSPFDDDGVQYAWDSTSLGLLKTCPRKYFLSMVMNWQPKRKSHHLQFGIWFHTGIEYYEKIMAKPYFCETCHDDGLIDQRLGGESTSGMVPCPDCKGECLTREDRHEWAVRATVRHILELSVGYDPGVDPKTGKPITDKTRFNLIRTLVWYFDHYGLDDTCETVILSSGKPAIELSFRFEIGHDLLLSGHLDRIVRYGDQGIYVLDHKTTASTVTGASARYYFKGFNPDNQMSLYSVGAAVAFQTPVKGVIIDAVQVAVNFSAFGRDLTHRSEQQLHEFLEGIYSYRRMAEHYHRTGFWPMNETACGNYGGCAFRDICARSPSVRERFLLTEFTQDFVWNPLEPR